MTNPDPSTYATALTDRDEYDAALVIATGDDATDVGAQITDAVDDPANESLWLVATAIWHVARTAQEAGGTATPSGVAIDAVKMLEASIEETNAARGDGDV